ncbi:MAG: hypothetical protein WDA00_00815 [Eubacteriales bacterium]
MPKQRSNKKLQGKPSGAPKDEGNNRWTNNNLRYFPDERERRDGPGGEDMLPEEPGWDEKRDHLKGLADRRDDNG